MKSSLVSPLMLPLCQTNEMGVYCAEYNTVLLFSLSAADPSCTHTHTSQSDDITAGYHLISAAISACKHTPTQSCDLCVEATGVFRYVRWNGKNKAYEGEERKEMSVCGGKQWKARLEPALPCTNNTTERPVVVEVMPSDLEFELHGNWPRVKSCVTTGRTSAQTLTFTLSFS